MAQKTQKTKDEITKDLHNLVNKYEGEYWNDDLSDDIEEDVIRYFDKLKICVGKIEVSCDDEGYITLFVDDFQKKKDASN